MKISRMLACGVATVLAFGLSAPVHAQRDRDREDRRQHDDDRGRESRDEEQRGRGRDARDPEQEARRDAERDQREQQQRQMHEQREAQRSQREAEHDQRERRQQQMQDQREAQQTQREAARAMQEEQREAQRSMQREREAEAYERNPEREARQQRVESGQAERQAEQMRQRREREVDENERRARQERMEADRAQRESDRIMQQRQREADDARRGVRREMQPTREAEDAGRATDRGVRDPRGPETYRDQPRAPGAERRQAPDRNRDQRDAQQWWQQREQRRFDGNRRDIGNPRENPVPVGRDYLSERERERLITDQRRSAEQYRSSVAERFERERRLSLALRDQDRSQQYRYQERYWQRHRDHVSRWSGRYYNHYSDPFFYTAPSYRYLREGRYYYVNQYAAEVLREAVRVGYEEGYYAGEADRFDDWRYSYRDNYVYLDANLGYEGYYVSQRDYNYYFRQGFRRGYEDGYYERARYGRHQRDGYAILPAVLGLILALEFND